MLMTAKRAVHMPGQAAGSRRRCSCLRQLRQPGAAAAHGCVGGGGGGRRPSRCRKHSCKFFCVRCAMCASVTFHAVWHAFVVCMGVAQCTQHMSTPMIEACSRHLRTQFLDVAVLQRGRACGLCIYFAQSVCVCGHVRFSAIGYGYRVCCCSVRASCTCAAGQLIRGRKGRRRRLHRQRLIIACLAVPADAPMHRPVPAPSGTMANG
jgi:hypothetical protein